MKKTGARARIAFCLLTAGILILATGSRSFAESIKPEWRHLMQLRTLSKVKTPSDSESLSLGYHHMKMGEICATLARTSHLLMHDVSDCMAKIPNSGVEWFAAVSMLDLGRPPEALKLLKTASQPKRKQDGMAGLCRIMESFTKSAMGETVDLSWSGLRPTTYADSLEIAYRLAERGKCGELASFPLRPGSKEKTVSYRPLYLRTQLALLACDGDLAPLEKAVGEIDSISGVSWEITNGDASTSQYSDPDLLDELSHAHFLLASHYYANCLKQSKNKAYLKRSADDLAYVQFKLRKTNELETTIPKLTDKAEASVYRGWVLYARKDTSKAISEWKKVTETPKSKAAYLLLQVLAETKAAKKLGESLAGSLLVMIEELSTKENLAGNRRARYERSELSAHVGQWYAMRGVGDSASLYYDYSRLFAEANLATYPPDYCLEYYASRIFSGRVDFMQEAYAGLVTIADEFPMVKTTSDLLGTVILCDMNRKLQK